LEQAARALYQLMETRATPPALRSLTEAQRWRDAQQQQFQLVAQQLSRLLLAPVQHLLRNKRLLIVPDGALHYVPFAALPAPVGSSQLSVTSKGANRQLTTDNRQPLIVNHELLTLPSASTLAVLRSEMAHRVPARKTLAVFADPVYSLGDERVAIAPMSVRAADSARPAAAPHLERLPATRQEAEFISQWVPPGDRTMAYGFAVNYTTATSPELKDYRYLHFATHGLLNNVHPALSGLALSQVNAQGVAQHGYLRTLDVFNLKLNAELVVLSGCRTALGKEVSGEGLIGLSRSFMHAGARRVLASLWQVNDAATAELMQRFYQGLLGPQKLSPSAALRAAQMALWRDPRWRAPYYWAAFTLQGEW
jgi:CHAT domain-containing protein